MSRRRDTAWEAAFRAAWRQEQWFLRQYAQAPAPEKLESALRAAFCKAFSLVFAQGSGVLLRAGRRRERACQTRRQAVGRGVDRRTLAAFTRAAEAGGWGSVLLSGAAGVGMGALGISLPDIPVFAALLLGRVYETAAGYGFSCESEAERRFALDLMETALCAGHELRTRGRALDVYAQTERWPADAPGLERQMEATARRLAAAMLYGKVLQGVPVVGALGGAGDAVCLRRIQRYAAIKYRKRFLIRLRRAQTNDNG